MNNYDLLIQKLDAFTRKYYVNQLMRGALIFLSCLIIYLLVISVGEYYFYFPAWLKLSIISILIGAGVTTLIIWIIIPLLKIQRLGKVISHEQAAGIIGKHFPEISDKLLNILQLRHNSNSAESRELIDASINQKAAQISVVPFSQAVDFGRNKRYLPYLLIPVAIAAGIFLLAPSVFRDASERLMKPDQNFSPPAPFAFHVTNTNMKVPLYGDYTVEAEVKGDKLPEQVFVQVGEEQLEMHKISKTKYSYTFNRVGQPIDFKLTAANIYSDKYLLSVIEKPMLQAFRVSVEYPAYTGKKNEELQSLSDMSVPAGTVLRWSLKATHTDAVSMKMGSTGADLPLQKNGEEWKTSARFMHDTAYTIFLSNKQMPKSDSFRYQMQVIPDLNPQVQMQEKKDSITGQQILLTGNASDDYGISRLYFHYAIYNSGKQLVSEKNIPVKLQAGNVVPFQQYFDFASLDLQPGQEVNYYMEGWDNDAVNGSKSGRSDIHTYRMFDLQEVDSAMDQNSKQINQGLSSSAEQAKKLQNDLKDMQNQLLQSDNMNWEKQQNMKSLADKQEQLKNQVEAIKKRFDEQKKQSEKKNYSDEVKEKQEAVQKQLDNLLNKELAEQLKKLQEMMRNLNKENAFQNLQQMEQQNKLFNMDMERIQELMKKLEMQMKMEDLAKKMDDLANRENQLQKSTDAQSKDNKSLDKDQQDIQKDLKDALQKDMKEIDKINNEQQRPEKTDDAKELGNDADQNMDQSSDQLKKSDKQKASQAQSKAQQSLKQMSAALKKMAAGMDAEQIDIDIKATRQILTNLIRFSFDQEKLMNKVKQTPLSSPLYVANAQEQNRLKANAKMMKDSLFTLSKRVFQIAATVNKETSDLEANINNTINALEGRRLSEAVTRQQYAMTSANNLALLLNELLSNLMESQAEASGEGQGQGKPKPGKGKGSGAGQQMQDIITGQESLGKGMEGKGKQQGGKQPGDKQGGKQPGKSGQNGAGGGGQGEGQDGDSGDAQQLAQMAQQQAALRRQIQELSSMLNSKGMNGNAKELRAIQDAMDKNETDLVNRKLNSELMMRQKEIMSRLLEAEKSIREQEEDNKRNANAGKDEQRPMPPELQQYLQSRQSLLDLYKTVPPSLRPYYKKMAEDYLKQVKQGT
jgi:hypothetical protein